MLPPPTAAPPSTKGSPPSPSRRPPPAMTLIQPRSADAFVRKPDAHMAIVLVYGPDTGLVSERVKALVKVSVDDPEDPFQLVQIDGDEVSSDPARLADEAFTIP